MNLGNQITQGCVFIQITNREYQCHSMLVSVGHFKI